MVDKISKNPETIPPKQKLSAQLDLLHSWRQTALNWVLRAVFVFATPVLILGVTNIIQDYHQGYPLAQAIGLGVLYLVVYILTTLITFVPRFKFHFRVGSLIFILFSIGLADLTAGGLSSDGLLIIFAAISLSAIFYDLRKTLIVQIAGMIIVGVIAWLLVSEILIIKPELQVNSANLASWVVRGVVLALLSTALVLATTYLVTSLERSLFSLQKQTNHLAFLNEIALDISSHKNMDELLELIVMYAAGLLQTDGSLIYLLTDNEETLKMVSVFGEGKKYFSSQLNCNEGMAGRVLESMKPLVVREYDHWEGKSATVQAGVLGSIAQVPILLVDKVIGILGCYTLVDQVRDFAQDDINLLQGLARQAAVAIDNINLVESARQAEERLEVVVQAAPSAIISANLDQQIVMFNKAAEDMFGYSVDEIVGENIDLLIPEEFRHSHFQYVDEFAKKGSNEYSALIARELVGRRSDGSNFPIEVSVSKVDSKGKMILTLIMQDITLRKETENALRSSERRTAILLNLSKALEISQTYEQILQASLDIIEDVLGYRNIWFYLYSEGRTTAHLVGIAGWKADQIRRDAPILKIKGDSFLEEIAKGDAPIVIEDARIDPRTNKDAVAYFENISLVHVPTYLLDRHLGVLAMGSFKDEEPYVPTTAELDFLSAMASHIAISIDRITQADERARAEAEIIRNNQNQKIINTLLQLALQNISLTEKLEHALEIILSTPWFSILPKSAIFLADKEDRTLKMIAHNNLGKSLQIACAIVKPGICLCGKAAESQELLFFESGSPHHETHVGEIEEHSHYNVPISLGKRLLGLFVLYLPKEHFPDEKEIEFLRTVANTLAGLIDRAKAQNKINSMNADLILAYDSTLEGWAKALDLRDKETGDHTLRVAELTIDLARSMGTPNDDLIHIWRGALLHDIGKMSIPDRTLKKADSLTAKEWETMRQHPQNAYDMLSSIPYLEKALDIPYCHHEKWDGSGYPRGLKGEDIPLAARIFSVVDVWDALRSDRPYRLAWDDEKVVRYIRERAGVEFDPQVVDAFFELIGRR